MNHFSPWPFTPDLESKPLPRGKWNFKPLTRGGGVTILAEWFLVYSIIDYQFNFSYRRLGVGKKSLKLNAFKLYDLFGPAHSPNVFLDVHEIYNSNGDLDLHNYEFRFPYICVRVEKKIFENWSNFNHSALPRGPFVIKL